MSNEAVSKGFLSGVKSMKKRKALKMVVDFYASIVLVCLIMGMWFSTGFLLFEACEYIVLLPHAFAKVILFIALFHAYPLVIILCGWAFLYAIVYYMVVTDLKEKGNEKQEN